MWKIHVVKARNLSVRDILDDSGLCGIKNLILDRIILSAAHGGRSRYC